MAARSVSPGGALLRASRMFSLPAPIPPPQGDFSGGTSFSSDTATLAFPTHQVITTLSSARKQGDWGLKRPLPLKSTTRSSNPMLRVKAIDTVEQITDYTSAADHGITLRKFQELGLPVTMRRPSKVDDTIPDATSTMNLPQPSVFEDEFDITHLPPEKRAEAIDKRWKFTGPWLAGMTQGEFNKWLAKEVRPKRSEFRVFLKKKLAAEINATAGMKALENGEEAPAAIDPSTLTEDQLMVYLRKLRHNNQALYDMVGEFLDLAPLKPPSISQTGIPDTNSSRIELREVKSPWAEQGPPVTHPSAGLSYLRTRMHMENHPIYGPQQQHAPTQARIVRPRRQAQHLSAMVGVAGFIVSSPKGDTPSNNKSNASSVNSRGDDAAVYDRLDPSVVGGHKVWVLAQRATVDSNGNVIMAISDASPQAVMVARELLGDATCLGEQPAESELNRRETASQIRERYRAADSPTMSSAQDYGLDA